MKIEGNQKELDAMVEFHKGNRVEGLRLQEEFAAEFRKEYKDKDHCPCLKACRYHGNCKECVAIHRAHQEHVPNCMRPLINKKLKLMSELTEHTLANEIEAPHEIDQSLNAEGSAVYKAVVDGEMVGGAVVIINESTQHNHLDLLFVKNGVQSNGIGKKIWFELERIYPNTKVWETCTPYFDKRNIHFYVNVCGFHITEFFNEKHPMPDTPDDFVGDGNEGMFAFKKQMRL